MNTEPVRRSTRQRAAIRELLTGKSEFRSAQQIHEELRSRGASVGLATVYRALQAMAEDGDLDVLRTEGGENIYRKCSNEKHHHHLVCRSCGSTVEIAAEQVDDWVLSVAAEHGFTNIGHDIELFGLCLQCGSP